MSVYQGSGKGHRDENFPVASFLIAPEHRDVVMAFYRVARLADDIADHESLSSREKLDQLGQVEACLDGAGTEVPQALALRDILRQRGLTDQHVRDLLEAFRRDAVKARYADWDELMDYCRYSAAPVGRFVLDVHGESQATWAASDALCAALQVINHLQDCGKDYRQIDRVYIPADALAAAGLPVEALGGAAASGPLLGVLHDLARRTAGLLETSRALAGQVTSTRLALEIGVIQSLAEGLTARLAHGDPLATRIALPPAALAAQTAGGVLRALTGRLASRARR
ncbi:MAG: squalene synthase HpnC, partial [Alphaproteobacteria bacterium]|nr:squalene synthase HpnC [Alphaproteobacteria bacterium]